MSLTATGTGGAKSITKTSYITVTACANRSVRSGNPLAIWYPYDLIQGAYDTAADGDYIEPMALSFVGDLLFGQNKSVVLKGGFDCNYMSNPDFTVIKGTVTIKGGVVTLENIVIQ